MTRAVIALLRPTRAFTRRNHRLIRQGQRAVLRELVRRRLAAMLAALAMASACRSPTAPAEYAGACSLGVPKSAPFVTICYNTCPPGTAAYAAHADMAYTALGAPCGTVTP